MNKIPSKNTKVSPHPTSHIASEDRLRDRENLARQMRTSQMMREQAREQINPTQIISELGEIDAALQGDSDQAGNPIPMEREIISALKARADIKFRLLDKVLPSVKATESISHNIHDHSITARVSDVEIATRLQLWRQRHEASKESDVEATYEVIEDVEPTEDLDADIKEYGFL